MRIQESFFPLLQWRNWLVLPILLVGLHNLLTAQTSYTLVGERGGEQYFAKMHVVSRGETLYGLSRQYKVSVSEIKTWNGLHSNNIDVGQRLIIETPGQTTTATPGENEVAKNGPDRGTEEIAFESHLSDLFATPKPPANQGWETETQDDSEWSPFGGGMNSRGEAVDQTSFTRRSNTQTAGSKQETSSVRIKQVYYQVKRGDDIYSIADKYKVRVDQLRAWNALVEVVPGDVIVVAKREVSSSTNQSNTSSNQRGIPSRSMSTPLDSRPHSTVSPTPAYRGETGNTASIMRSDQAFLGDWMEKGAFIPYEGEKYKSTRFYALHKTLPIGSTFKVMIPGNGGYFEVKVVGRLAAQKEAIAALSYDTIRLLEGGIQQSEVTIYYDK